VLLHTLKGIVEVGSEWATHHRIQPKHIGLDKICRKKLPLLVLTSNFHFVDGDGQNDIDFIFLAFSSFFFPVQLKNKKETTT
jgi:hypothetical protein